MPFLAIAWGVKPHIVQLTSRSPRSFFFSIKGKLHLKCGVCVCVVLPGLHPGDGARVPLVTLQEAPFETFGGVWDAHLLSPVSCLALFQVSLFLLLAKSFHFSPVLRGVTSLGPGFPRSPFSHGSVFKQLPSSGFLGRWEISSFSRWEISSTVGINVC